MRPTLASIAIALASLAAAAQTPPELTLTRIDCGTIRSTDTARFSDTYSNAGLKVDFTFSCYLVKHGGDYMLWDTGHEMTVPEVAPKTSLPDLLGQLSVKPDQIKFVGISHYHGDHIGQAASFP